MSNKILRCAYLYADGHTVEIWEKADKDAGRVEWIEIREAYAKPTFETGRVILSNPNWSPLYDLIKDKRVDATVPVLRGGSENTEKQGFQVGGLTLNFPNGKRLHFRDMPGLISGEYTYQPDVSETFEEVKDHEGRRWGLDSTIKKVHRKATQSLNQSLKA